MKTKYFITKKELLLNFLGQATALKGLVYYKLHDSAIKLISTALRYCILINIVEIDNYMTALV